MSNFLGSLHKWGQGQLFAYSALDGESLFTDDFTGTLTGDKIGVIFHTLCRRTLYFADMNKFILPELECVTSDMILLKTLTGSLSMIFAERHLVVGEYTDVTGIFVSLSGESEVISKGETEIHRTADGEYTALLKRNGSFAFAYGKSESEAIALCEKGITLDLDKLKAEKIKPFEKNSRYRLSLSCLVR